jgi:hypothetical protein
MGGLKLVFSANSLSLCSPYSIPPRFRWIAPWALESHPLFKITHVCPFQTPPSTVRHFPTLLPIPPLRNGKFKIQPVWGANPRALVEFRFLFSQCYRDYGYLAYPSSIYRFCHRDYIATNVGLRNSSSWYSTTRNRLHLEMLLCLWNCV